VAIGILYESDEWSDYALCKYINDMGVTARLINLLEDNNEGEILSCDLVVSRIFASSVFRGHQKALDRMPGIIDMLRTNSIPMINPYEAHFFEISKEHSTNTLARSGFPVPKVYGLFTPEQITRDAVLEYPCVVKPDCGGRTNYTYIVKDKTELARYMEDAPNIQYIAEEYIFPEYGYLTRIEVIGGSCKQILKRGVTENGLSAYHLGSTYAAYEDCNDRIKQAAVDIMGLLHIEAGSMDIIENRNGFYVIDINSVSNASADNIEMFGFDLIKETAAYVVMRYLSRAVVIVH